MAAKKASRPVDAAMAAERPAKVTVRDLWVDKAVQADGDFASKETPLYLTLSGEEAKDIQLLIKRGLVRRTEVGGIAEASQKRVVAIEASPMAVATLQRSFPGLKILEIAVGDLVRGEGPTTFPTGDHERYCRARIINLDLNTVLSAKADAGGYSFPVLTWIRKFCQLHAKAPRVNWTLLLTLHGEIPWDAGCCQAVQAFLAENFALEPLFAAKCCALLGQAFYDSIRSSEPVNFSALNRDQQRQVLMMFVPKKLARIANADGWRVETARNICYGEHGEAPMVTWVIDFIWDARIGSVPEQVYRESLCNVLAAAGQIAADGTLTNLQLS